MTIDANIDNAYADSAEQPVSEVQTCDCGYSCSDLPAQSRQRAAKRQQGPRPELIDDEPLTRRKKRLDNDEERERNLDLSKAHMERTHERLCEQRPDILRARDDNHAAQPQQQLNPARAHHRIGSGMAAPSFRGSEAP